MSEKPFLKFLAITLGPGILLLIALAGFTAFDAYVLGNCDAKLGCAGSVQLTILIAGLALLCSFCGHFLACLFFKKTLRNLHGWHVTGIVLALSLGQAALTVSIPFLLATDSITAMMASWAAISSSMALVVLSIARHWTARD